MNAKAVHPLPSPQNLKALESARQSNLSLPLKFLSESEKVWLVDLTIAGEILVIVFGNEDPGQIIDTMFLNIYDHHFCGQS